METLKLKAKGDVVIMIPSFWQINPHNVEDLIYEFQKDEVKELPKNIALFQAKVNSALFELAEEGYEEELNSFNVAEATKPFIPKKPITTLPQDEDIIKTPEELEIEKELIEIDFTKNEIRKKVDTMSKEEFQAYLESTPRNDLFNIAKILGYELNVKFNEKKEIIINKLIELIYNEKSEGIL